MKKILFVRNENAFLPEIPAYIKYFNKTNEFIAYDSSELGGKLNLTDFDVIWEFKGFGGLRVTNQILIHEYASLSTGAFPILKNQVKTKINPKPNLRIFLNKNVKLGFNFKDDISYCYRDMGVDCNFFIKDDKKNKDFDFVYVGSISKGREIDKLLYTFTRKMKGTLLLVGSVDDHLYNTYKDNKNITFTGRVRYQEVPQIAINAEYGINYMPNRYPFNIQTSTKLLEYLAMGLKVITTDYFWVRQFEQRNNCSFFKLDINNFNYNELEKHNYVSSINIENFLWENVIERSGVYDNIQKLFS
ncbi:glycosyltransferase [Sporosarcina luteola]|uniref:glycosyltransferase n=1 Tax=Sporosarcina luteola TaxID=582850 RepID=UPI00203B79D1|nr:glycosyltransferase [Sporosarcina luteola]MCM3711638.1 glycosyltransferase [Sporosarcina luteola]